MSRPPNPDPSYVRHASGRARAVWTDSLGIRHFRMLPGPFGSDESRAAHARLKLELLASPATVAKAPNGLTIAELLADYLDFAERHYRRPDGNPTDEVRHLKVVIRRVRVLYGERPAAEFGPLALKAVRQQFVDAGWCRKSVNSRVERIRRIFKWAVAEELIPSAVYQALTAVPGLTRGRTTARETEPVGPVKDAVIGATLAHLNRHVRGLVEFQRLTGCRPGEAMSIRRADIDTGGAVWFYRPRHHKTAHHGKTRAIAIGPQAQALLRGYFTADIDDYLFSPARQEDERLAERAAKRVTPRWPSHMKRNATKRVADRERPPGDRYHRQSYLTAVERACDRAFPLPPVLAPRTKDDGRGESRREWWARLNPVERTAAKEWRKAHHWHPNQLRHTFATMVRRQHGLEAAQVLLGHSRADVTQLYAERDEQLAVTVAAAIG